MYIPFLPSTAVLAAVLSLLPLTTGTPLPANATSATLQRRWPLDNTASDLVLTGFGGPDCKVVVLDVSGQNRYAEPLIYGRDRAVLYDDPNPTLQSFKISRPLRSGEQLDFSYGLSLLGANILGSCAMFRGQVPAGAQANQCFNIKGGEDISCVRLWYHG